jgi:hypothetical protein
MDAATLKQAWLILKEIGTKKSMPAISDKKKLESQLAKRYSAIGQWRRNRFRFFYWRTQKEIWQGLNANQSLFLHKRSRIFYTMISINPRIFGYYSKSRNIRNYAINKHR